MKKILFRIRYWLMPQELKEGTWIALNGDFINIGEFWRKTKKGWHFEMYWKDKKLKARGN